MSWCFNHPANSSAAWIIFWNVQYLCFWVRTKNLGSTLHRSIVVEVLLDLLSSVWRTAVGRMNRLSWRGGKQKSSSRMKTLWFISHATLLAPNTLTLFFLHLHHLPLPLIKGGDILGVFAAHRGICVWGNRGAQVLSDTRRRSEQGGFLRVKMSSHDGGNLYLFFHHVGRVGVPVLRAGSSRRARGRVGVCSCSVNVGSVLQNNWRIALETKETILSAFHSCS